MTLIISDKITLRNGWQPMDPDAAAYITAVETADGQALEEPVKIAIDNFVLGCKADGIWNAIKASCILAGARTLSGALVPLAGTTPANYNFVAGDYDRKTGLVGDGSTKYLDSNRNNNADPQDSNHNAIYISVANSVDPAILIGDGTASSAGNNRIVFATGSSANLHFDSRSSLNGSVTAYGVNPTGFIGHSRSSAGSAVFRVASASTSYAMASNTPTNTKLDTPCPLLLPCTVCGDLLPPFSFSRLTKENGRKDILGNSRLARCKKCAVKKAMARPLAQRLWYAARKRAKLKNLPFDIDVSDIEVPEICPILGIRLKQALGRGAVAIPERNASASLDRIDNKKGYLKGNVAVISMRANHVKADGTTTEIAAIADFMKRHDEHVAEKEKEKNPWLYRLV